MRWRIGYSVCCVLASHSLVSLSVVCRIGFSWIWFLPMAMPRVPVCADGNGWPCRPVVLHGWSISLVKARHGTHGRYVLFSVWKPCHIVVCLESVMSLWCEVFREDRVGTMQTHCFLLFHGVHGSTLGFEAVRIPWAHAVHYAGQMSCLFLQHGV